MNRTITARPSFLNGIKQEALAYTVIGGKKNFERSCFKQGYTIEECCQRFPNHYIGVMYEIRDTNYAVIDIDTDDYTPEDLANDTDIDSVSVVGNTKGYHIWCELKSGMKTGAFKQNKIDCGVSAQIDYIGEKVFERIDKVWDNIDSPPHLICGTELFKAFKQSVFEPPIPVVRNIIIESKNGAEKLKEFVNLIDIKYCNNRESWFKIIMAMKKVGFDFAYADEWSKKSKGYDGRSFGKDWDGYSVDRITGGEGTLRYYAKKSCPQKYQDLIASWETDTHFIENLDMYFKHLNEIVAPLIDGEIVERPADFADMAKSKQQEIIQKIKEDIQARDYRTYLAKKNRFELNHAKILRPATFVRIVGAEIQEINRLELEHIYESIRIGKNSFTQLWTRDIFVRKYERVDFLPPPLVIPLNVFNSYNGLRAERLRYKNGRQDISIFLRHMRIMTGGGDNEYDYYVNFMAHLIQKPGEIPGVSIVFQGVQGTGKSSFLEAFAKAILGDEYLLTTADIDKITGKFQITDKKLMVVLDETSGKDTFANAEKLKHIITEPTLATEKKGIQATVRRSCLRLFATTNTDTPMKIEAGDRRFVVYTPTTEVKNNRPYFAQLAKAFHDDDMAKSLYEFLMEQDLELWDIVKDRPHTQAYEDIQSATIPPFSRYVQSKVFEFHSISENDQQSIDRFKKKTGVMILTDYKHWLSINYPKMEINPQTLGKELKKWELYGITKKGTNTGIQYKFDFETVIKRLNDIGLETPNKCLIEVEQSDEENEASTPL